MNTYVFLSSRKGPLSGLDIHGFLAPLHVIVSVLLQSYAESFELGIGQKLGELVLHLRGIDRWHLRPRKFAEHTSFQYGVFSSYVVHNAFFPSNSRSNKYGKIVQFPTEDQIDLSRLRPTCDD